MIIRRRHNGNFTVVGNAAINDDRLSFEAVGLLTYILSKPDDWEVRLPQLRKRANIGRDKLRRIVGELCRFGYVLRKKLRDATTGAFVGDEFHVYDQPQIVDDADIDRSDPEPENPALGEPATDYPAPENPSLASIEDSTKDGDSPKTDSTKSEREGAREAPKKPDPKPEDDPDFQKLLKRYPGTNSPNLAFPPWLRLDVEGRRRSLARLDAYIAELRKVRRDSPYSLQRYLSERLFDQVDEPADGKPVQTVVRPRTDEWWALFWRRRKAGERVRAMLDQAKGDGAWGCALDTLPDAPEIAALAEIETGSSQFRAWTSHLATEGLRLGGEACGKFIRVPSEWPPGWVHGPPDDNDPEVESERMEGEGRA